MNAKAYLRAASVPGSWKMTYFSDCFSRVAMSGRGSKLFKNHWWSLDSEFNFLFAVRLQHTTGEKKSPWRTGWRVEVVL